jgi:chromosome partitioning protein
MIISITNQKGGVGKTTTSQSMAIGLNKKGYKVLLIDLDPQANLSYSLGANTEQSTIYEVLKKEIEIKQSIQSTGSVDIIPSNILLSGAELEFTKTGREYLLKEVLNSIKNTYEYIIIDTPPALSILTVNAFTASNKLIIPMGADVFSLQGAGQLNNTINQVKRYCNNDLKVAGILLTRYNPRTILSKDITSTIQNNIAVQLETKVFNSYIRSSVSIQEAQTQQANILEYAPNATAQVDYAKFVDEFIQGNKND